MTLPADVRDELPLRVEAHEALGANADASGALARLEAVWLLRALGESSHPADPACVAWPDDGEAPRALREGDAWRLEGDAGFVAAAPIASHALVCARAAGGAVVLVVATGGRLTSLPVLGGEPVAALALDGLRVPDADRVGPIGVAAALRDARACAAVLVCAQLAGAARAAVDFAAGHARERRQFGAPIATFQAVRHRLADALLDSDAARLATQRAAMRIAAGADPVRAAALARPVCSESAARVTASAHQVVGAAGIYADSPLHRWHRHVKALEWRLGSPDAWREALADAMGL